MKDKQHTQPAGGIALGDIYFALFRHKWKIIICSLLGLVGAIVFYFLHPPSLYESEAKVYVKYVVENGNLTPDADTSKPENSTPLGVIMSSEVQFLTSL